MTLLILPGASDPNLGKHKEVYDLIINEAKNQGYSKIILAKYPGQKSFGRGKLTLTNATNEVIQIIHNLERERKSYKIIGRSFGCCVALKLIADSDTRYLQNVALWGPTLYYKLYELFKITKNQKILIQKGKLNGVHFHTNYFNEMIPIEVLVSNYNKKIPIRISSGEKDDLSGYSTVNFLKSLTKKNKYFEFIKVPKLIHEVTEYDSNYIKALF